MLTFLLVYAIAGLLSMNLFSLAAAFKGNEIDAELIVRSYALWPLAAGALVVLAGALMLGFVVQLGRAGYAAARGGYLTAVSAIADRFNAAKAYIKARFARA